MTYTDDDITAFIHRFETHQVSKSEWTHEKHFVVAFYYIDKLGKEAALEALRELIKAHNTSIGTANTEDSGYHETLTVFWIRVISRFLSRNSFPTLSEYCNAFLATAEAEVSYPLAFYTKQRLFSVEARHAWIAPDIQDLLT